MKGPSTLPSVFDELLESPQNPWVQESIDGGKNIIGYTCSLLPEALLSVEGLVPIRLRAPNPMGTPMADTYLSSVCCPYPRSLLELVLEGRFDFLGGWVFAASCDHLRRLYDNIAYLTKAPFNHIVDVPHKRGAPAVAWFVEELGILADALSKHFSVDTGTDALNASIARLNGTLEQLRRIGDLRRRTHPPISGTDFHKIMIASVTAPKAALGESLQSLLDALQERDGIDTYRARLMVVGAELDDPTYLQIIEKMGGLVVADRFCFGSLPGLEPIPENGDPFQTLAEHHLKHTKCPRMMEDFEPRLSYILQTVQDYKVDGVVFETMKFCDIWGIESSAMVSALRDEGVPVLRLEREYALTGEGQLRTRIQAFLESMGR